MNTSILFNKSFRFAALASAVALGAFGASNSFAADAESSSDATVIVPIAIAQAEDLDFGKFAPGVGGTVTVATDGARSASGTILSTIGSSPTAAKFDVTGDSDATYLITLPATVNLADTETSEGGEDMAVTLFSGLDSTSGSVGAGQVETGTLSSDATGAQSIFMGGELAVAAEQAPGTYTGTVTATVEYN
jgi:spore coat protein U-like protein